MSHLHSTIEPTRKKYNHLTFCERQKLETLMEGNRKLAKRNRLNQGHLALMLQCSEATISRELRRGQVELLSSDLTKYTSYSAVIAQADYDFQATNKGPELKLTDDPVFIELVEEKILEQKWSPDAVVMYLEGLPEAPCKTKVCTRTLYNYIEMGLFFHIGLSDLPREERPRKKRKRHVRRAFKAGDAPLISERPLESTERLEPGHWEMDCIVSGKGKGKAALLTMIDRCTRETLIFKLKAQTQKEVFRVLNTLERGMGLAEFLERFKTITVDNGSEFLNWKGLQKSVTRTSQSRTKVYFCHPYSAFERGTNEQNNGVIRYHIPKGACIGDYSKAQIQKIQDWLNSYPRRVLGGKTANQAREAYERVA